MRRTRALGFGIALACLAGAASAQQPSPPPSPAAPQPKPPQPAAAAPAAGLTEVERLTKAREVAQAMADRLKAEIGAALKVGVVEAIGACHTLSPEIADQTSATSGFEVTRTALKLRNPENAPDAWEAKILEDFQRRLAGGADITRLDYYEIVANTEGDRLFRYMKAIPVQESCLACHGTEVKQSVKAEIAKYYPEDKATGFRLGELRGAFSLVQLVE